MSSHKEDEASTNLADVVAGIEKQHGKGSIMMLGAKTFAPIDVIPTSSIALDAALGVGGLPRGRVVEIFGPECLDADTFIQYEVRVNGRRANHKGGSIKRLYERFHKLPHDGDGRGAYERIVTEQAAFYAPSINEKGRIFQNRILNVVASGKKECFRIKTAKGYEIFASRDHKFWTGDSYAALSDLSAGDSVYIHNNTPFRVEPSKDSNRDRIFLYVRHHPIAGIKTIAGKYKYHRLRRARAVIEAHLNGLSLGEFVDLLNADAPLSDLKFLSRDEQVHHKDENETNDAFDNLEVLAAQPHSRNHALNRHNNLRFQAIEDRIIVQEYAGERETFDLQMNDPHNNFVANGFVVHNSGGKTTLALHCIAEAQKLGGKAAFIDAEHALDPVYARKLGVDVDHLLVSQPDNGEQALEITEALIKSGKIAIIVVDSVAALVPRAELEGDMGDPQMGLQARLMSQALRKLTGMTNQTKTVLIFINQIREKIGVMFGSPETTTGGRALKFFASVRLDIRKYGWLKDGDVTVGAETRIRVVKNKVATPHTQAEVHLLYGHGISREWDLLQLGEAHKVLDKTGTWFSYKGEKLGQGIENARIFLVNHVDIATKIDVELRNLLFKKG